MPRKAAKTKGSRRPPVSKEAADNGQKLKLLRTAMGLEQKEMAKVLEVGDGWVSDLETGKTRGFVERSKLYLEAFGLEASDAEEAGQFIERIESKRDRALVLRRREDHEVREPGERDPVSLGTRLELEAFKRLLGPGLGSLVEAQFGALDQISSQLRRVAELLDKLLDQRGEIYSRSR